MKRSGTTGIGLLSSFLTWLGICMGLSVSAGNTGFMAMFWFFVFLGITGMLAIMMVVMVWKYI